MIFSNPRAGSSTAEPRLRETKRWICALGFALWCVVANATTVIPPSFDALVNESDYIIHSRVKSVSTEKRPASQGVKIVTRVELEVLELIAGSPPSNVTLELLGGKVGDEEMQVEGMPRFIEGDEDILFVRDNGRTICPLYGMMHGRYGVRADSSTGQKYLVRVDETPLHSSAEISAPLGDHSSTPSARSVEIAGALAPAEFIRQIKAAIRPDARLNRAK